jgi:hypothetical protein
MVSPAFAYVGEFGTHSPSTGSLMEHRLQPQIARTEDGNYIFYTWVDQDTAAVGYGELTLLLADLRTAMLTVSNGLRTLPNKVTDADFVWSGRVLFPTMAPTVIEKGGNFHLPLVALEMLTNDQSAPCRYWYFGNELTYSNPNTTVQAVEAKQKQFSISPNPSTAYFQLNGKREYKNLGLQLFDLQGRVLFEKQFDQIQNIQLDLSFIPNGVYFVKLTLDQHEHEVLKWIKY